MITQIKTSMILLLIPFYSIRAVADKAPIKFGNVSEDELKMEFCEIDSSAEAMVLCDYGTTKIQIDRARGGFQVIYERICRIKIFSNHGYDWASESIHLYNDTNFREDVTGLKGFTYNLVDGKIEKTKLSKESIFEDKASDEWTTVKFTLPDVKEGSVIEYTYQINSDRLGSLKIWEFQKDIPVKWSEYVVEIPEYFNYLKISSGYEPFVINKIDEETRTETFMETERTYNKGLVASAKSVTSKLEYKATIFHWAIQDAPGLRDERFVGNVYDYLTKVEFQLSNYTIPGYQYENVLGSWEDINDQLLAHNEDFKNNIAEKRFYSDDLDRILAPCRSDQEKMTSVYHFVANRMQWDGLCDYIPNQNIRKTFDEQTGSASDINSLLISMLRAAGLNADPVILSTRDNGQVHPIYPILRKYNYLIAMVSIGDQNYLLDATEKNIPPGMLPLRCLNQRGRCISTAHGGWVDLQPAIGAQEMYICNLKIDGGTFSGNIQTKLQGYSGVASNKQYTVDGEEKYLENLAQAHPGWEIKNYEADNSEPYNGFKEKFDVAINNAVMEGGNMLYIDPIIVNRWDDNPLKNENRKFPVDLDFPMASKYISNILIPENYQIEELPESIQFSLPDKSASYTYVAKVVGNMIQLMNNFEVSKSYYTVEEYEALREFWSLVVTKNNEQIVLKKSEANEF
jgi:hypothetical protein